jgi:hypothetical protein
MVLGGLSRLLNRERSEKPPSYPVTNYKTKGVVRMDETIMVNIGTKEQPNFVERLVESEAEMKVYNVIRGSCCNLSLELSTTFDEYQKILQSGITYSVLKDYREHRYQKIEDAFYVISKCAGYLYELMTMYKAE